MLRSRQWSAHGNNGNRCGGIRNIWTAIFDNEIKTSPTVASRGIYIYIYIYTYTYLHIYIYTNIQLYIYTYIQLYIYYIYTYIHIYIYTYTHIHIHIHLHIYIYIYIYTYTYTHIHIHIYIYTYTYTFTYLHIHIHLYIYIYTYTYTHIHIHIYIYTYTYTYTYYIHIIYIVNCILDFMHWTLDTWPSALNTFWETSAAGRSPTPSSIKWWAGSGNRGHWLPRTNVFTGWPGNLEVGDQGSSKYFGWYSHW